MKKCSYTIEDISNYIENSMSDEKNADMENHLKECSICKRNYSALKLTDHFLCKEIKNNKNYYNDVSNYINGSRYMNSLKYKISSKLYRTVPKVNVFASVAVPLLLIGLVLFFLKSNNFINKNNYISIREVDKIQATQPPTDNQKQNYTTTAPVKKDLKKRNIKKLKSYITITDKNITLENISKKLFEIYLDRFKETDIEPERIKDYKIEYVDITKNEGSKFEFYVTYSILPETDNYILAGNGVRGKNGWIVEMGCFVVVSKNNNTYSIENIGTSPYY